MRLILPPAVVELRIDATIAPLRPRDEVALLCTASGAHQVARHVRGHTEETQTQRFVPNRTLQGGLVACPGEYGVR